MNVKHAKEESPGNDVLNGVERWIPEDGKEIPKQFTYRSQSGFWYKSKWDEATCLARTGVQEENWCPPLTNPWPKAANV